MKRYLAVLLFFPHILLAQTSEVEAPASPRPGWGEFEVVEEQEQSVAEKILYWFPNRIVDLYDVFRVDIGLGFSYGAVGRVSKYGQFGYRSMSPASARVGLFGRKAPYLMERSSEFGGPFFYTPSTQREIGPLEVGLGVDLAIAGAYAGIQVSELADFISGVFFYDLKKDDLL